MNEENENDEGKRRLALGFGIAFAFLFAITWSLPSGFGWTFFAASGYCFFLYWYYLPKRPKVILEVEDEEGRRFEYQETTEQRTQALVKKIARIVWIAGIAIFSFLLVIGFFSSKNQASEGNGTDGTSNGAEMDETQIWNSKGSDFYSNRQYDSALYYYERVLRLESNNATAWYNKGLVYYDQQRVDEALDSFSKAYDFGMRDAFLSHVLGYLNDNKGNTSRAIIYYKEAVGMDSTRVDIYTRLAELEPGNAVKYKELEAKFKN